MGVASSTRQGCVRGIPDGEQEIRDDIALGRGQGGTDALDTSDALDDTHCQIAVRPKTSDTSIGIQTTTRPSRVQSKNVGSSPLARHPIVK